MITDFRGNDIIPGAIVAFTLSGTIAIGRIVKAVSNRSPGADPWRPAKYKIEIEVVESHMHKPGHISKVKHPSSIMVLEGLPMPE